MMTEGKPKFTDCAKSLSRNLLSAYSSFSPNSTGNYAIVVSSDDSNPILIPELIVDGESINATISTANESDLYRFNVTTEDTYTIQTNGVTDTFMTLHGPNSQIPEIARNDDGGASLNARIRRQIASGEYFVRVRHFFISWDRSL